MTNKINIQLIDIDTTEEFILNPNGIHPDLKGWRCYRIEYGGCNQECIYEGRILLPSAADPVALVQLILGMQAHAQMWETIKYPEKDPT